MVMVPHEMVNLTRSKINCEKSGGPWKDSVSYIADVIFDAAKFLSSFIWHAYIKA